MNPVTPEPASASLSDPVLAELIEEITRRLEAGSAIDLAVYQQAHPAQAQRLAELMPALRLVAGLADENATEAHVPAAEELPFGALGDFRLLREVGRGGMGGGLRGRADHPAGAVALKVLPFAAALDPRQLARFKNEARAAAHLHHPHIVPVHAVGCERGVHYYAMQFIDGRTLAGLIADCAESPPGLPPRRPRPAPDRAVGRGRRGLPRVVEWAPGGRGARARPSARGRPPRRQAGQPDGGRRRQALGHRLRPGPVQSDTRPDLTGDLVGTLRYMSPEQALAGRVVVDHRTDVYSLGATLYELLTLRPAFSGTDRQELLRKIAFEEPAPAPAARKRRACRTGGDRPEGHGQEPGRALRQCRRDGRGPPPLAGGSADPGRPPSLAQRLARWGRRHRPIVAATLAVLVLAVLGLAISTALIANQQHQTSQALANEREALRTANDERRQAEKALNAESEAKRAFQDALGRERQLGYGYSIGLAWRYWQDNDLGRARQLLEATPPALRGWEYDYVDRLIEFNGVQLAETWLDLPDRPIRTPSPVRTWSFSADGKSVSVSTSAGVAGAWDTTTGKRLSFRQPHEPGDKALKESERLLGAQRVASMDGTRLFARLGETVLVIEAATGKTVQKLDGHKGRVTAFVLDPDGNKAVSAGLDGGIHLWDVNSGKRLLTCGPAAGPVVQAWWGPNGPLTLSFPGTRALDHESARVSNRDRRQQAPAPAGGGPAEARLTLWDAATGKALHTWPSKASQWRTDVGAVRFADGGILAVDVASLGPPETCVLDAKTGKELRRYPGVLCGLSKDGSRLLLDHRNRVVVEDVKEGKRLADLPLPEANWNLDTLPTLSSDGRRFAHADRHCTILVRDARTGAEIAGPGLHRLHDYLPDAFERRLAPARRHLQPHARVGDRPGPEVSLAPLGANSGLLAQQAGKASSEPGRSKARLHGQ